MLMICLTSCGTRSDAPKMYIEKARLSEQEQNIATLLGADTEQLIYDFILDKNVKSLQINTYELIDGTWNLMAGGGGESFSDKQGRVALDFKNLAEGLRIALQSENTGGATTFSINQEEDVINLSRATSSLNELTEIIYEQEIPLVIQILTSQNGIATYNVESFFEPERYEKYNYEHVYAITIRFSQKDVGELDIME